MIADGVRPRLLVAALLAFGACERKTPANQMPPAPISGAAAPARRDVFVQQVAPRELSTLIAAAHANPAVASLEAAGCDFALVMTGAAYDRFITLGFGTKMPKPIGDPASPVVYCSSREPAPPPPDCAALAPIFARVARPKRRFHVLSGFGIPPLAPRCSGVHDAKGKLVAGEGPGYPSSR